ncbi:MAG: RNA polymerase sigma factor [Bacteroidaceae bacterium]|nr:RNA polymerase sigma factor [Bacteroidaceae bacterium]
MNRQQFTELVLKEQEALRRFLLTLCCGNRDDADDLAQETLVKAYLSSGSYSDEGKFKAWLYKIAYNTFVSSRRAAKAVASIEEAADIADLSLAPDRRYKYQSLYAALSKMQPKERTALVLFYMNDYSIKEISRITDAGEDAVKKQLQRGRDHLRQFIKAE